MWRWAVVIPVATVALALSPLGRDIIYSALFSGEQLARNIWLPILLAILGVLLVLAFIEYGIIQDHRSPPCCAGGDSKQDGAVSG